MRLYAVVLVPFLLAAQQQQRPLPRAGSNTGAYNQPAVSFHGTVKHISSKDIVIVTDEEQEVVIHRTRKTSFEKDNKSIKPANIPEGALITVDVTKAPDASLEAVKVFVNESAPKKK